jgi:DUF218 domain
VILDRVSLGRVSARPSARGRHEGVAELRPVVAMGLLALASSCVIRDVPPTGRAHDARFGFLAAGAADFDRGAACGQWEKTLGSLDTYATSHVSFPETSPDAACFTRVTHAGRTVAPGRTPPDCAMPDASEREAMRALADRLGAAANPSPLFPCALKPAQREAAAKHNASVLRHVADQPETYPYTAILVPGFGNGSQAETSIASWLPGDACHPLSDLDRLRLGAMVPRTRRASDAWHGGVAPMVLVTGGFPHSSMIEAFAMLFLLECDAGAHVPEESVLVEPCAEHTHTNLRDAGRWLVAMGARTGYLVTDDEFQSDYFQDWTGFNLIAGSLDARSLRDWGYLVGSWRQASVGIEAGFWFTPYRFWAEPQTARPYGPAPPPVSLGSFTCVMSDGSRG